MKRIFFIMILLLLTIGAMSQTDSEITGTWNGTLNIHGVELRLVFHIEASENGYKATMDSPDQNVKGIPVSTVSFDKSTLNIEVAAIGMTFKGELKNSEVAGTFTQSGMEMPLILARNAIEKKVANRPQTPVAPFPYRCEDVTFYNQQANITLAGTLTLPQGEGKFPVVVFISGSGAQNRDEELFEHKPFFVFADFLARNGIAALRFDDRGYAKSGGSSESATSADFATDVESAIAYLKTRNEVDAAKIGLIGHSEGGIIAPMVAAKHQDINFIVLLAGPGISGDKLLLLQQELIYKGMGMPQSEVEKSVNTNKKMFEMVTSATDMTKLKSDVETHLNNTFDADAGATIPKNMSKQQYIDLNIKQITNPWMVYFLKLDPSIALKKTKCAVLAINGESDLQVPFNENLTAIRSILTESGNSKVTTKSFVGLNHLFQECKTGLPTEYAAIEQTISPEVLEFVTQWIRNQTK